MTNQPTQDVIENIRHLYQSDEGAQKLFDRMAQRQRNARGGRTKLDQICSDGICSSRRDAVALARKLEATGCGQFIEGRHGHPSRIEWNYSCISLGQAAAEESSELDDAEDLEAEENEEVLTFEQAKLGLANYLGIDAAKIEIVVRA